MLEISKREDLLCNYLFVGHKFDQRLSRQKAESGIGSGTFQREGEGSSITACRNWDYPNKVR